MKTIQKMPDGLSIFSISVILVALVISIYVYTLAFSGGLSTAPDNWSAFGTYIGGIFGPLISFVTLIAILKTISLQKELLNTQRSEFMQMQALQDQTFKAQQLQYQNALEESKVQTFERTRDHLLSMADRHLAHYVDRLDSTTRRLDLLCQWALDGKANGRQEDIKKITDITDRLKNIVAGFHGLMAGLSLGDFQNPEAMKAYYSEQIVLVTSQE